MFDGVEPFKGRPHATGVFGVRCRDVSERDQGKSWNSVIVLLVPGPSAPKNMAPYMERTVQAAKRLWEVGMWVTQQGRQFWHRVLIASCLADTPARLKLGNFAGVGAIHGACSWCRWEGIYVPHAHGKGGGVTRYKGYSQGQVMSEPTEG
jgi:hypothetical protein